MRYPADPTTVPGLPECRLTDDVARSLPGASPPAPWACRVRALLWVQHARVPHHPFVRRPLPLAAVAFVHYLDTPVGGYHEILAGAVLATGPRPSVQVPFIAVDSLASVHGGRVNWALPKVLADFTGDVGSGTSRVDGDGWSVRVTVGRRGPQVPVRATLANLGPLGRSRTVLRGTGRPAMTQSSVQGATIHGWLGGGRHLGLLFEGTAEVGAPMRWRGSDRSGR